MNTAFVHTGEAALLRQSSVPFILAFGAPRYSEELRRAIEGNYETTTWEIFRVASLDCVEIVDISGGILTDAAETLINAPSAIIDIANPDTPLSRDSVIGGYIEKRNDAIRAGEDPGGETHSSEK